MDNLKDFGLSNWKSRLLLGRKLGGGSSLGEISTTLSLAYVSLFFLVSVGHTRHARTSQSLHFLFLTPGRFLSHISTWVPFSIPSELCSDVTGSERPSSRA